MFGRALLTLALLLPSLAYAQELRRAGDWVRLPDKGCIGGSTCPERRLRVAITDERPVIGVRFHAHDQIGEKAGGVLRVKIDSNTIESHLDIPRAGKVFTIDVDELIGRAIVFEPVNNDEVEIRDVEVLYGRGGGRRRDDDWGGGGGRGGGAGWRQYPRAAACIGGDECRKNGNRITIALDDQPVLGVRFYAHDQIGQKAGGKLRVRIDNTTIGWTMDVERAGKRHEVEVDSVTGTRLVIETASDDEVDVKDIEVLYGRRTRRDRWEDRQRETTHEGGCIGGADCGGRRARIRVPIFGRTVASVRFYARDDIGTRAGGEVRVRIDDEIIRDYLDIPREGRTFTIDGRNIAGDYLIIEPTEDDEVMVRDVRVTFGTDEEEEDD
jgi:hypothetical protein